MADGLCTGETLSDVIEKTIVNCIDNSVESVETDGADVGACDPVDTFYSNCASEKLYGNLCGKGRNGGAEHEDILDINMPSPADEDCRKKRCVDRYDSSESSDSGVAILSCTDCSGSSTASSDITDPGSPFSTASSHSEDSGSQPAKMPPTQNAHHPPWLWTDEQPTLKRMSSNKPAFSKRIKTEEPAPKCLNNNNSTSKSAQIDKGKKLVVLEQSPKLQQGKITEYFKSQYKSPSITKKELSNIIIKSNGTNKFINLVESNKKIVRAPHGKVPIERFQKTRSVPRKILPAPSKQPDKVINVNTINPVNTISNFPPIITTLIPNLAYIQTKAPKPPEGIFVPQFTINDKINTIPIVNRTSCILQPLQKITTINNFNCVKLNTAVVPIVKLNMPSKSYQQTHGANFNVINTAMPTVLAAKPKVELSNIALPIVGTTASLEMNNQCLVEEMSPADSGVSSSNSLEVNVDDIAKVEEEQKSPILSQPKIIRFPAKQRNQEKQKIVVSTDTATCQWDQCAAQFDTNGALLEHLQVKHVISQATQEQYVCLWHGCKVHGRKSCSRSWLERHVLAHAGSKPFRCIVDGCGQRFNSQLALERHVNGHFNTDSSQNGSTKKSVENGSVKLFRKNGKKIRFRRQPWSARMFDFMDCGIMEGLQYKLLSMTEKRTMGQFECTEGDTITLQSQILARRVEQDGTSKMLLRWHPRDIVDDEWVSEKEYITTRTMSIPNLQPSAKDSLKPVLFPTAEGQTCRQKHRRKPCKDT